MRHKGIWIAVVLIVILLAGFGFNTYYSFHNNGFIRRWWDRQKRIDIRTGRNGTAAQILGL